MNRHLLWLIFFLCLPIYNYAQIYKVDSLLTQLEVKVDTQSISGLSKMASSFQGRNADSLLICAKRVVLYSKQINYEPGLADGFQLLTSYFHYHLNDNATALLYIDSALNLNSKLKRNIEQVRNFGTKGNIQSQTGNFNSAIQQYEKALTLLNGQNQLSIMGKLYNSIGNVYLDYLKEYDLAYEYFNKSLEIFEKLDKNSIAIPIILSNIGTVLEQKKTLPQAIFTYKRSIELAKKASYTQGVGNASMKLAYLYKNDDKLDSALHYLGEAELAAKKVRDNGTLMQVYFKQGEIFQLKGSLGSAEKSYLLSEQLAVNSKDTLTLGIIYDQYFRLLIDRNDFQMVNDRLATYIAAKQSLFERDKLVLVEEFRIKFEAKEKEIANQKLQLLNIQKEKENRNLVIILLTTVLIVIFLVFVYLKSVKIREKLRLDLISESRKAKRVFSNNLKQMTDLWNQLSAAKNNHSANQEKIHRLSEELFKTFDLCYPHFTNNLNGQYPDWKISDLQLKLCKLFALEWFDSKTIVSMNITTKGGLKQARLLIRRNLDARSNPEIYDQLKILLQKLN